MIRVFGRLRAGLYDATIVPMTTAWYRAVLERLPTRARLLDVGIGTGGALLAQAALLVEKDLYVTGVDIDAAYVECCQAAIAGQGLADRVTARLESIYAHQGGPYDAVYFSGSFMLLPDPAGALRHVATLLAPGGRYYFTQTFEQQRSPWLEMTKPLLRWVTTIDFGRVTYESEFRQALTGGQLAIDERTLLGSGKQRAAMLVSATPE